MVPLRRFSSHENVYVHLHHPLLQRPAHDVQSRHDVPHQVAPSSRLHKIIEISNMESEQTTIYFFALKEQKQYLHTRFVLFKSFLP